MLLVDLSNNNAEPDWHALKTRSGIAGMWHKAGEGATFHDPKFARRRACARSAGIRFGAYWFARPDVHPHDPWVEAQAFCRTVGQVNRTDLRPVLDYERVSGRGTDEWWIRTFNKAVRARLGVGPLFYSNPDTIRRINWAGAPGGAPSYGLWLASYGVNDGVHRGGTIAPPPWRKLVAHQYSDRGRVPGCVGFVDVSFAPRLRPLLAHPFVGAV